MKHIISSYMILYSLWEYKAKIKYDDIAHLFLLSKTDDTHMAIVIALDKPIRQGQQRYQILVLQTTKEQSEVT